MQSNPPSHPLTATSNNPSDIDTVGPNWLLKVIDSFDQLSYVLAPENAPRLPTSAHKVPWEIRPRNRSIQQVFRAIRVFPSPSDGHGNSDDAKRAEITRLLLKMRRPIESFLSSSKVRSLSGMHEIQERWLRNVKSNGAAARRRRAALGEVDREAVALVFSLLSERIRDDLLAVEEVLWPRRIIKLGPPPPEPTEPEQDAAAALEPGFRARWPWPAWVEWFSIVAWVKWILGR